MEKINKYPKFILNKVSCILQGSDYHGSDLSVNEVCEGVLQALKRNKGYFSGLHFKITSRGILECNNEVVIRVAPLPKKVMISECAAYFEGRILGRQEALF